MFRFEHHIALWALAVIIPLIVIVYLFIQNWKKRKLRDFGNANVIERLMPNVAKKQPVVKFILFTLAMISLLIGIANLQYGTKLEEVKREGVDLMIALDVSNSMLTEDLSPNRLERAKRAIYQLIEKLHNDRLGIIVFAGEAYVQLPITTDYSAAKLFLETIGTDIIPKQGTAIGSAIDLAMESFDFENSTSKSIIVITDGENHEDDAVKSATAAAELGVLVHTIGMGSEGGAPIPIYRNGKQIGFRTDNANNTVVSKLNESMLKEIATAGEGTYVRATNANAGLGIIMNEINQMEKTEFDSKSYSDYEDRFQPFLLLALLLFVIEFFISNRKSSKLDKINLFKVKE
ncbi:VWA domain-containing protein [Vicingus serpentipes]|uniref:VWA domain-containing protein n=1 Tax=Vicingus serpentipes TaxID=1926625 RepID=A0A5C6RW52_9FLAO|nr:VWA domain-containing protein [Vicingus serpentipes]TXB66786.1 VWA domain-containing protein [Vicingus serpentipes]